MPHQDTVVSPQTREVAILFADIRNYTQWVETSFPESAWLVFNRYLEWVLPVIARHGGVIDHLRGDGFMAIFGAPASLPNSCNSSVSAARQLLVAVRQFNQEQSRCDGKPFQLAIGIAYGTAVCGQMGCLGCRCYTAMGDVVNVAARLQDLAKQLDEDVLITAPCHRQLTVDRGQFRALGSQRLRGHSPVEVLAMD
jgi:adenylate cyclase